MSEQLEILLWAIIAFLSGSVPYAVALTRVLSSENVRSFGDRNPGAANAWKAGGWQLGVVVAVLDFAKAIVPVVLAQQISDLSGYGLTIVAFMPILGHAYSPFLLFRGGKALSTSAAVWSVVGWWETAAVLLSLLAIGFIIQRNNVLTVLVTGLGLLILLIIMGLKDYLLVLWLATAAMLLFKHRHEIMHIPEPRHWVIKLFNYYR